MSSPTENRVGVVSWNVTRRCTLRCAHCYLPAGSPVDAAEGELTTAELFRIADGIAAVNSAALVILTGGEPLLRPDVYDLARHLRGHGMTVVVATSGIEIDDHVAGRLAASGVQGVGVSIDALAPAAHDGFRGRAGAFETTLRGLEAIKRARLEFLVQTTVTRENRDQVPELVELAQRLGAQVFHLYFLVRTGRARHLSELAPAEIDDVLRRLHQLRQRFGAGACAGPEPGLNWGPAAATSRGGMLVHAKCAPQFRRVVYEADPAAALGRFFASGCPAGQFYCRIDPEGDLTPCPFMPLAVGNLRRSTFADLWWNAPLFLRLRDRRLGGRCGACEFSQICGGCRCKAYAATGDPLAEDPSCGYQPGRYGGRVIEPPADSAYMAPVVTELTWTEEARLRIGRIPFFARGMVVRGVEQAARARGIAVVTGSLLEDLRARRTPFHPGNPGGSQVPGRG